MITIDPVTKYLKKDGKLIFGCPTYGLFSVMGQEMLKPDSYLFANKDFTYALHTGTSSIYLTTIVPMARKINMPWTKEGWNVPPATPEIFSDPLRMGYLQYDEPATGGEKGGCSGIEANCLTAKSFPGVPRIFNPVDGCCYYADMRPAIAQKYTLMKQTDPGKLMHLNIDHNGNLWATGEFCDILTWDNYPFRSSYPRDTALYQWEKNCETQMYKGEDLTSKITCMPVLQTLGQDYISGTSYIYTPTSPELRAQAYAGICQNTQGIVFLHDMGWGKGLDFNPSLLSTAQDIAAEIKILNDYLVSPTTAYAWYGRSKNPSIVTLTNQKTVLGVNQFSWILKSGLLIVVNKDSAPVTTQIRVAGLTVSIITTTGISPLSKPGRTISVLNETFTDTFDGLAVHIYQLSSQCPPSQCNITITQ